MESTIACQVRDRARGRGARSVIASTTTRVPSTSRIRRSCRSPFELPHEPRSRECRARGRGLGAPASPQAETSGGPCSGDARPRTRGTCPRSVDSTVPARDGRERGAEVGDRRADGRVAQSLRPGRRVGVQVVGHEEPEARHGRRPRRRRRSRPDSSRRDREREGEGREPVGAADRCVVENVGLRAPGRRPVPRSRTSGDSAGRRL